VTTTSLSGWMTPSHAPTLSGANVWEDVAAVAGISLLATFAGALVGHAVTRRARSVGSRRRLHGTLIGGLTGLTAGVVGGTVWARRRAVATLPPSV
jgi:hypothetical protein